MRSLKHILLPFATLLLIIGLWQLSCMLFNIPHYTLPSPVDVGKMMVNDWDVLKSHLFASLSLSLAGLGLGLLVGIAVALTIHLVPILRIAVAPLLLLTQNIPLIALGPLLMIWFGFGLTPKLILLVLVCFFPIALSLLVGLGQAEPQLREYLAMIGATRWERMKRLEFPASLPYLFSGLRIAASYVVSSAIVAEWLGANKGIGFYLQLKFKGFQTASVFASIVCIIVLSLLYYGVAVLIEQSVIRWRPRTERRWKEASQ